MSRTLQKPIGLRSWPYSKISSPNLPAVIAYADKQILWGFEAVGHQRQISNLRGLLEDDGRSNKDSRLKQLSLSSGGKDAIQVIGDFLSCALEYIVRRNALDLELCQYIFVIPSSWGERETGSYAKAITHAVPIQCVTFCRGIEAGIFWMIRKLRTASQRRGRLAMLSDGTSISHVSY